jgi:hypothetical protein
MYGKMGAPFYLHEFIDADAERQPHPNVAKGATLGWGTRSIGARFYLYRHTGIFGASGTLFPEA